MKAGPIEIIITVQSNNATIAFLFLFWCCALDLSPSHLLSFFSLLCLTLLKILSEVHTVKREAWSLMPYKPLVLYRPVMSWLPSSSS